MTDQIERYQLGSAPGKVKVDLPMGSIFLGVEGDDNTVYLHAQVAEVPEGEDPHIVTHTFFLANVGHKLPEGKLIHVGVADAYYLTSGDRPITTFCVCPDNVKDPRHGLCKTCCRVIDVHVIECGQPFKRKLIFHVYFMVSDRDEDAFTDHGEPA